MGPSPGILGAPGPLGPLGPSRLPGPLGAKGAKGPKGRPVPQDPMNPWDSQDLWYFRPPGTSGPQDPWEITSILWNSEFKQPETLKLKDKQRTFLNYIIGQSKQKIACTFWGYFIYQDFIYLTMIIRGNNPGQNTWQKVKKYSKIGQNLKNFIYNFACFLTAIVNVKFLEGRLGTRLRLHPNLTFF